MPVVGEVLADRYRIEAILGVGGMASVYRATDLRLNRQVAVKVLAANLAADSQLAERFNREAGAMAGFNHPNVASVYDVEVGDPATGREPFYVMEHCPQGSLADRLRIGGRMPPAELIPVVAAVSEGLAELHSHGLIHRDVKPANILFASDRAKLADFGVAWNQGPREGDPLTLPGSTIGTAPYLAPELRAGGPPSPASDVYALGVTIFLALTGQYPRPATTTGADADALSASAMPVSAAAPDLGLRFDDLLARALDADPAARPSPVDFAAQLTTRLETWGVARPNLGAADPPDQRQRAIVGVDSEAKTRVAQESPQAAQPGNPTPPVPGPQEFATDELAARQPAPEPELVAPHIVPQAPPLEVVRSQAALPHVAPSQRTSWPWGRTNYRWPAVLVTAGIVLAVLVMSRLGGDPGFQVASPPASAEASPLATATAAVSATAPSGDTDATLAALSHVESEIEASRGGKDGLKGREGTELRQLATSVRTSIDGGDLGAAATAAQGLSDRARELATNLDESRRASLLAAIDGLLAALSAH